MRRVISLLMLVGILALSASDVMAGGCLKPPSLDKMTKAPCQLCKKPKKVGEDYMGKCAAPDANQCCRPKPEKCPPKCCNQ